MKSNLLAFIIFVTSCAVAGGVTAASGNESLFGLTLGGLMLSLDLLFRIWQVFKVGPEAMIEPKLGGVITAIPVWIWGAIVFTIFTVSGMI